MRWDRSPTAARAVWKSSELTGPYDGWPRRPTLLGAATSALRQASRTTSPMPSSAGTVQRRTDPTSTSTSTGPGRSMRSVGTSFRVRPAARRPTGRRAARTRSLSRSTVAPPAARVEPVRRRAGAPPAPATTAAAPGRRDPRPPACRLRHPRASYDVAFRWPARAPPGPSAWPLRPRPYRARHWAPRDPGRPWCDPGVRCSRRRRSPGQIRPGIAPPVPVRSPHPSSPLVSRTETMLGEPGT